MASSSDSDGEEIGPEDGTVEIDRAALLKRVKSRDTVWETTRFKAVLKESTTASVKIPKDLLRQMSADSPNQFITLDIPLEFIDEPLKAIVVKDVEFEATIDEFGIIAIPKDILKSGRLNPGQHVQIVIKTEH